MNKNAVTARPINSCGDITQAEFDVEIAPIIDKNIDRFLAIVGHHIEDAEWAMFYVTRHRLIERADGKQHCFMCRAQVYFGNFDVAGWSCNAGTVEEAIDKGLSTLENCMKQHT